MPAAKCTCGTACTSSLRLSQTRTESLAATNNSLISDSLMNTQTAPLVHGASLQVDTDGMRASDVDANTVKCAGQMAQEGQKLTVWRSG